MQGAVRGPLVPLSPAPKIMMTWPHERPGPHLAHQVLLFAPSHPPRLLTRSVDEKAGTARTPDAPAPSCGPEKVLFNPPGRSFPVPVPPRSQLFTRVGLRPKSFVAPSSPSRPPLPCPSHPQLHRPPRLSPDSPYLVPCDSMCRPSASRSVSVLMSQRL